jgi:hypothetical protein
VRERLNTEEEKPYIGVAANFLVVTVKARKSDNFEVCKEG